MDIRKMTSEELDKLSHLDIAYNIIKTEKKVLNTIDLLKEICSISLEHEITQNESEVLGNFLISGEYKIHELSLNKEKFNFLNVAIILITLKSSSLK